METKFTKGKWKTDLITYDFDKNHRTIEVSNNAIWVCQINSNKFINETEAKANALLISKTPKMFEMLLLLIDRLEENDLGHMSAVRRAKELIKEATEL